MLDIDYDRFEVYVEDLPIASDDKKGERYISKSPDEKTGWRIVAMIASDKAVWSKYPDDGTCQWVVVVWIKPRAESPYR